MPISITVPRLGWSMEEGTFVGWLKQDGEAVKTGEPLFTLEGDKASQEIEATDSGILRIPPEAPKAGDTVSVGALLGYLGSEDDRPQPVEKSPSLASTPGRDAQANEAESCGAGLSSSPTPDRVPAPPLASTCADTRATSPGESPASGAAKPGSSVERTVTISPRARRRAAELGLDYRGLKGSGRTGRIIEADVLAAAREAAPASASPRRRTIAQRTAESFARAPHFYLRAEVDAGPLVQLRERLLPEVEQATGVRLSLTDLLLRAQAVALRDCAAANAIWQNEGLVRFPVGDVGLVVGLEDGLLIPILRGADLGPIAGLVRQRASLVEAARAGKLTAEVMQGGATSLSNLGNTRMDEFAAVIAPPQSSMLAVGRAAPRPFVVDGQLVVRTTLRLCLSVDHRVMDGGPAAEFLGRIADLLERPDEDVIINGGRAPTPA